MWLKRPSGTGMHMMGRANLFGLSMLLLLLIGGAGLLVHHRIWLDGVQLQRTYLLMGTQVDLKVRAKSHEQGEHALEACFQEIRRIQDLMNAHAEDSGLSRLNVEANDDWAAPDPEIFSLIDRSLGISRNSQGAFDITVGPLLGVWREARQAGVPPSMEEIQAQLAHVGYANLRVNAENGKVRFLKKGMHLDLGGIAKGYALDQGKKILLEEGIQQALLNAGGDVLALGMKGKAPWSIGIRDPRDSEGIIATVKIADAAVVTSGDYERFFLHNGNRYHHILDPRTGSPTRGCRSVTVVAPWATEADAMATAAFVMGPRDGMALLEKTRDVDGIIIDDRGNKHVTSGLRDKVIWKR
jgi:thiamine biosynthesis lipoprotein